MYVSFGSLVARTDRRPVHPWTYLHLAGIVLKSRSKTHGLHQ